MPTEVAVAQKAGALAELDARLAAEAAEIRKSITVAGNYIQLLKNSTLKMPNGEERDELDAVIIGYRYRKQYFPKPYKRGEFNEVTCFSTSLKESELAPSSDAPDPQHPSCAACPKNQFKSALNGGAGKACQDQFLMTVMLPDLGESEEIYLLKAPPTSSKPVASYVLNMTEQQGHPIKVITKFRCTCPNDWQELRASYAGPNPAYAEHAVHMDAAKRLLVASPTGKRADEAKIDTAVDKKAQRKGRSATS